MALITVCDICKNKKYFDAQAVVGEDYCDKCQTIINNIEAKCYEKLKKEFDSVINNRRSVMNMLRYIAANNLEQFEKDYGIIALKMLNEATGNSNQQGE